MQNFSRFLNLWCVNKGLEASNEWRDNVRNDRRDLHSSCDRPGRRPRVRAAPAAGVRRAAKTGRSESWPRSSQAKPCKRPRWCMRPTCGWWAERRPTSWDGRRHFFAAAAEAMRRILIDRARHKQTRQGRGRTPPARPRRHRAGPGGGERRPLTRPGRGPPAARSGRPAQGRAGQAPVLRRPHRRAGGRRARRLHLHCREGLGVRPKLAPGGDRPHVRPPALTGREEKNVTGSAPFSRIVFWTGPAARRGGSHDRITARQRGDLPRRPRHPRTGTAGASTSGRHAAGTRPGSPTSRRCWRPPTAPTACWTVRRRT